MSLGLLAELQSQLLIAKDVGYLSKACFDEIAVQTVELSKVTNGLIKSVKVN